MLISIGTAAPERKCGPGCNHPHTLQSREPQNIVPPLTAAQLVSLLSWTPRAKRVHERWWHLWVLRLRSDNQLEPFAFQGFDFALGFSLGSRSRGSSIDRCHHSGLLGRRHFSVVEGLYAEVADGLAIDAEKGAYRFSISTCYLLEGSYVLCLQAFGTFREIELYALAFPQAAEAASLNC